MKFNQKVLQFFVAVLMLVSVSSFAFAQADLPAGWGQPNTHGPLCSNEGFACRFDGDCCQGVCKNFQVCDAGPLYCVPPHFQCNTDQDCCKGECSQATHECSSR